MINSQFSASALGSRCDKITKIRSSTISYQQVPKVNNICVGICLYVSCSEVINNVIARVFKTVIKDISTTCTG